MRRSSEKEACFVGLALNVSDEAAAFACMTLYLDKLRCQTASLSVVLLASCTSLHVSLSMKRQYLA